jgi:hypothetical protein
MKTTVILSDQDVDRLELLAREYPLAPRHRLTQAAMRRGLRELAACPEELLAETVEVLDGAGSEPNKDASSIAASAETTTSALENTQS